MATLLAAQSAATCPPGRQRLATVNDTFECVDCPEGSYCLGGRAIACPENTHYHPTLDLATPKQSNLSSCAPCPTPEGVKCAGDGVLQVRNGWWMLAANASAAYRCAWSRACPGQRAAFADASCEVGYEGVLCGKCRDGFYRGGRACYACDDVAAEAGAGNFDRQTTAALMVLVSLLVVLAIALLLEPPRRLVDALKGCVGHYSKTPVGRRVPEALSIASALAKICLGYSQCLGAIARFSRVRWPPLFTSFMRRLDEIFTVELFTVLPVECIAGTRLGFYTELFVVNTLPVLLVLAAFGGVVGMRWAAGHLRFRALWSRWPPRWRDESHCCARVGWELRDNTPGWLGVRHSWNQPGMYKLLTWSALIAYPPIARKSLAVFDCVAAVDEAGVPISVLRDDPVWPGGQCDTPAHAGWCVFAALSLVVYCAGLPLAALYLSGRFYFSGQQRNTKARAHGTHTRTCLRALTHAFVHSTQRGALTVWYCMVQERALELSRVALLVSTYEKRFWYGEALTLLHRFVFTALIHLIWPEFRLQLWVGVIASLLVYVMFQLTLPYQYDVTNAVQSAAFLQLLLTYISAFLFYDGGGGEAIDEDTLYADGLGLLLVGVNSGCFIVMVFSACLNIIRVRRTSSQRRLRYDTGQFVGYRELPPLQYHLFLSHIWATGQDQVRIIRERLLDMFPPGLRVFLDVEEPDFEIDDLEGYIDRSDVVLVLATQGYFQSYNCMRELRRAVQQKKQLICVLEPEPKRGRLTRDEVREELGDETVELCDGSGEYLLSTALLASDSIEWNRLGVFQMITMRLIAQRLLPYLGADYEALRQRGVLGTKGRIGSEGESKSKKFAPFDSSGLVSGLVHRLIRRGGSKDHTTADELPPVEAPPAVAGLAPATAGLVPVEIGEERSAADASGDGSSPADIFGPRWLCQARTYTNDERATCELTEPPELPHHGKTSHLLVSMHNAGAASFVDELNRALASCEPQLLSRLKWWRRAKRAELKKLFMRRRLMVQRETISGLPTALASKAKAKATAAATGSCTRAKTTPAEDATAAGRTTAGKVASPPPSPPIDAVPAPEQAAAAEEATEIDMISWLGALIGGEQKRAVVTPSQVDGAAGAAGAAALGVDNHDGKERVRRATVKGPEGDEWDKVEGGSTGHEGKLQGRMKRATGKIRSLNQVLQRGRFLKDTPGRTGEHRMGTDGEANRAGILGAVSRARSRMNAPKVALRVSQSFRRAPSHHSTASSSQHATTAADATRRVLQCVTASEDETEKLSTCMWMLILLNRQTWGSKESRGPLGRQIAHALMAGVPLLLVHEAPGMDLAAESTEAGPSAAARQATSQPTTGAEADAACEFNVFFEKDQTPQPLRRAGIYGQLAITLKRGGYRPVSLALVAKKICEVPPMADNLDELGDILRDFKDQGKPAHDGAGGLMGAVGGWFRGGWLRSSKTATTKNLGALLPRHSMKMRLDQHAPALTAGSEVTGHHTGKFGRRFFRPRKEGRGTSPIERPNSAAERGPIVV